MFRIRSTGMAFLKAGINESTLFVKGNFPFLSFPCECPLEVSLEVTHGNRGLMGVVKAWKPYPRSAHDLEQFYRALGIEALTAEELGKHYYNAFDFLDPNLVFRIDDPGLRHTLSLFLDYLRVNHLLKTGLSQDQYLGMRSFFRGEVYPYLQRNPYFLLAFPEHSLEFVRGLVRKGLMKASKGQEASGILLQTLRHELDQGNTCQLLERIDQEALEGLDGIVSTFQLGKNTLVAFASILSEEVQIAESLKELSDAAPERTIPEDLIDSEWQGGQRDALRLFCQQSVMTLSGLPGTGKSTVVKEMVKLCKNLNLSIQLLAPTGMAARRLSDLTQSTVKTVHSFLGYDGKDFHVDSVPFDVVLVDEMSMVDTLLFAKLVKHIDPGTRLVLVGDDAQLPSVGPGAVFRDILSARFPGVRLTHVYRQEQGSMIVQAAHKIHNGEVPTERDAAFQVYSGGAGVELLKRAVMKLVSEGRSFQVMAPMYKGPYGIDRLNLELRSVLNPDGELIEGTDFYRGDRVVFLENTTEYSNGDFGTVTSATNQVVNVMVDRSTQVIGIPKGKLRSTVKPGYCISVHRSQGNEYDTVFLFLQESHGRMLERTLFYTAVTRAKRKVLLFSTDTAMKTAIESNKAGYRRTALAAMLAGKEIRYE